MCADRCPPCRCESVFCNELAAMPSWRKLVSELLISRQLLHQYQAQR